MSRVRKAKSGNVTPLRPAALRAACDPKQLGFKSTRELEPIEALIGQSRVRDAIKFGTHIKQPGYNLFVLGPQGTGRHTAILSYLGEKSAAEPAPADWVYVHNFAAAHKPKAMKLPPGTAIRFRDAMAELVDDLRIAIPTQFQSDDYRKKRQAIDGEFEEAQEQAFEALRQKAEEHSVAIMRTPVGFALAPMQNGQVVKPEVFNALPKAQRESIEAKINELQNDLAAIIERMPLLQKQHREKIRTLNEEVIGVVVDTSIKVIADRFAGLDAIQERLKEVRTDLVQNPELFLEPEGGEMPAPRGASPMPAQRDLRFNRYLVNVMVSGDQDGDNLGAPLVREDHPTLANLVGRVEHLSQFGALVTDFTMIRPGALHGANGGYLVLEARKVLSEMFAWEALKRALNSNQISIVSAAEQVSLVTTTSLEPEPIPVNLKVILIGERQLYYLLSALDPEFSELFKVEVDFDENMPRTAENVDLYARLIATITVKNELLPLNAAAVARVIDELARTAEDAERLSLRVGRVADLLREADFWAREANRRQILAKDVDRAIGQQIDRASRVRDRMYELIDRETVLIDAEGSHVGQVNGLSVSMLGKLSFGQPSRITARVRMGSGKVIDIERETKLGGPLHSKGVLILSSYLAANYALDVPVSLWASLVFEQSYGGVDGDSASSTELYALLSALSEQPINQALAVTGSVNQHGQVQAIGGVNQKIEGFFDICSLKGLTGKQGVLIPSANVKHLMLRSDVVRAAASRKFHIYPISTIDEGIEVLTGIAAGKRGKDGLYPAGSINRLVEDRLREFALARKRFGSEDGDAGEKGGSS